MPSRDLNYQQYKISKEQREHNPALVSPNGNSALTEDRGIDKVIIGTIGT